jgi:hypothetical protein
MCVPSAELTNWLAYNNLRVICSVAAWLGSCMLIWKDLTQINAKSADLFRYVLWCVYVYMCM